jgi:hypothetical protein
MRIGWLGLLAFGLIACEVKVPVGASADGSAIADGADASYADVGSLMDASSQDGTTADAAQSDGSSTDAHGADAMLGDAVNADAQAPDASPDAGQDANCPGSPPMTGDPCFFNPGLQCLWTTASGVAFGTCDANGRWSVGNRPAACPTTHPTVGADCPQMATLFCDYSVGTPGDCIDTCQCGTGEPWYCASSCGCTPYGSQSPCPDGENIIETGTEPATGRMGFCPASTTMTCSFTKSVPQNCGVAEMSSTTVCQCSNDRWQCTTQ